MVSYFSEDLAANASKGMINRISEVKLEQGDLAEGLGGYDRRRAALAPYGTQRDPQRWGEVAQYGWSEDKARQYAEPQRSDFGAYVRACGFDLR